MSCVSPLAVSTTHVEPRAAGERLWVYASWLLVSLCCALLPRVCVAQFHRPTGPVLVPASTYVLQDDAMAAEVNPALIGFMPELSLAYVHAEVSDPKSWLGRGDALHVASPLLWGLSAGLSLHSVRPGRDGIRIAGEAAERGVAVLSLAYAPSKRLSVGLSARGVTSSNRLLDGLGSLDVGVSFRPSPVFGVSLVARDLLLSREGFGSAGLDVGSSYSAGLQLRPFGTTALVLDGALSVDTSRRVGGRVVAGLAVPRIGLLSALAEFEPTDKSSGTMRVMAELSASYGRATAAFGAVGDERPNAALDWYGFLRLEASPRTDRVAGRRILDVELSSLSARGMLNAAMLLTRAIHDRRVGGVLLRMRNSGLGTAYAQEIRLLLAELRQRGKVAACHLENATGTEFYACSGSTEVSIDPAGSIRLLGPSTTVLLFGDTLKKLHVRAEFLRIGAYKGAPEQFTNRVMSEEAREQMQGLLNDVHRRLLVDLSADMSLAPEQIAQLIDSGPYTATPAVAAGMANRIVDAYELASVGTPALPPGSLTKSMAALHPDHFGVAARVGVVLIDDTIVDGESSNVPVLGLHSSGAKTVIQAIEGLAADPTVRAIVLRVDSPGGAVLASDQIWRAVRRARTKKPVVASMGRVAASGGYYVASAADEIWADPSTVTGSIGIYYGKVDVSGLADELGVGIEVLSHGKRAAADSMYRAFTPDERAAMADGLKRYYKLFLARVAEGRGMSVDEVDALGRGRVFTGDVAIENGLIDRLGGFASALARARQLARLGADAEVIILPESPAGLVEMVLSGVQQRGQPSLSNLGSLDGKGRGSTLRAHIPAVVRQVLVGLATWQGAFTAQALAIMPFAPGF